MKMWRFLGSIIMVLLTLVIMCSASYACGAPEVVSPLEVYLETLDMTFAKKTEFYTGEIIYFNVTIVGKVGYYYYAEQQYYFVGPTTCFVFVQVESPIMEYPFLFVDPNRVISPGEVFTETPGWWIPYGAVPGTYKAYVYLCNTWPSAAVTWIFYDMATVEFTVRE